MFEFYFDIAVLQHRKARRSLENLILSGKTHTSSKASNACHLLCSKSKSSR